MTVIISRRLFACTVVLLHGCNPDKEDTAADTALPPNAAPVCAFLSPETNSSGEEGTEAIFEGTATDAENITDELSITLSSDLDGSLGDVTVSGDSWQLSTTSLSVGTHQISLSVSDPEGLGCTADILYTIGNPPTVELLFPEADALLGS